LAGMSGYPIVVLKEGHKRETGRDVQRKNIMAAIAVAEAVRSTLGPKGMDKMMVDNTGDAVVTNDGATILWEMDIEHPVAKMIVEVAKAQDDEVGDGTTTAVIVAGELLKKAESLIDKGIHPTTIVMGYKQAAARARSVLDKMAISVSGQDRQILTRIAQTAMTGKSIEGQKESLSQICIDAALAILEDGKVDVDNRIKIVKITGGRLADSNLNRGVVLEMERVSNEMPRQIKEARIALLDGTLELKKLGTDAKITISHPESMMSFKKGEEAVLEEQVESLARAGANVVFCQKGIGVAAQGMLARRGILAARRVKDEDMKLLALATGGRIVGDAMQITPADLGSAELVEERKVKKEKSMIFVEGCKNPRAVSIIVHGGSEVYLDEQERALHDALYVVGDVLTSGRIVAGGGAAEVEMAEDIRHYASTLSGREQLAVTAFAEAIEAIPKVLAENAGLDPVDILVSLRSAHGSGQKNAGLDASIGKSADMVEKGVVEPLRVKEQVLKSASEAAAMVLRVDDLIAAKREELKPKPGQSPHDYTMM